MLSLCTCAGHERSKLDLKMRVCIFVGYGQDEFGYQLWDPIQRKIVRSLDVEFVEDKIIEDSRAKPQ